MACGVFLCFRRPWSGCAQAAALAGPGDTGSLKVLLRVVLLLQATAALYGPSPHPLGTDWGRLQRADNWQRLLRVHSAGPFLISDLLPPLAGVELP